MDFDIQFEQYRRRAEQAVQDCRPRHGPPRLNEATDYSLAAGGKRLRPILLLAAADLFGPSTVSTGSPQASSGQAPDAGPAAAAVEYIHTYSLIHDDLPCGRPTVHRQFDEATALLAGDTLLTHAFVQLAASYGDRPPMATQLVQELGRAASGLNLIGGQVEDMLAEKNPHVTAEQLRSIHLKKTAAMIAVSLVMGGIVGGATPEQVETLRDAGEKLGLTFQIVDDILDATADTATLGKTAGKDAKAGKTTYVKLHGLEASRQFAHEHTADAVAALGRLPGDKSFLIALVQSMAGRKH